MCRIALQKYFRFRATFEVYQHSVYKTLWIYINACFLPIKIQYRSNIQRHKIQLKLSLIKIKDYLYIYIYISRHYHKSEHYNGQGTHTHIDITNVQIDTLR